MSIGVGIDEEIARLRALVEEQQERLQRLEGQSSSVAIDDRDPRSRRDLLRLAGLGLAGAAGASLLTALPAAAANGGNLILGQANDASSDTSLSLTGAADYAFKADATNGGNLTSGTSRGLEAIGLGPGPDHRQPRRHRTGGLGFERRPEAPGRHHLHLWPLHRD